MAKLSVTFVLDSATTSRALSLAFCASNSAASELGTVGADSDDNNLAFCASSSAVSELGDVVVQSGGAGVVDV